MYDINKDTLSRLQSIFAAVNEETSSMEDDTINCEGNCDTIEDVLERAIDLAILFKHDIDDIMFDWYNSEDDGESDMK